MSVTPLPHDSASPLAPFTLESLLERAAQTRPRETALGGAGGGPEIAFADLAARAGDLAARMAAAGLLPGETVVILAAPQAESVVALLAASRLGLSVAMAPLDISAPALALAIRRLAAAAVLGPGEYGGAAPVELAFLAAPLAQPLRLIGTFNGPAPDGAIDFSPHGEPLALEAAPVPAAAAVDIITFERQERALMPVRHQVATLTAAALALIARGGLAPHQALVSTIPPASFAGLVAGPLAMLLSGAALRYNGPFDSVLLQRQLADGRDACLIAPARAAESFAQSGARPGALWLLSRWRADAADFAPPHALTFAGELVDLHAFGERALAVEPRDARGRPSALLEHPHMVDIAGERLVALSAREGERESLLFAGAGATAMEES